MKHQGGNILDKGKYFKEREVTILLSTYYVFKGIHHLHNCYSTGYLEFIKWGEKPIRQSLNKFVTFFLTTWISY